MYLEMASVINTTEKSGRQHGLWNVLRVIVARSVLNLRHTGHSPHRLSQLLALQKKGQLATLGDND